MFTSSNRPLFQSTMVSKSCPRFGFQRLVCGLGERKGEGSWGEPWGESWGRVVRAEGVPQDFGIPCTAGRGSWAQRGKRVRTPGQRATECEKPKPFWEQVPGGRHFRTLGGAHTKASTTISYHGAHSRGDLQGGSQIMTFCWSPKMTFFDPKSCPFGFAPCCLRRKKRTLFGTKKKGYGMGPKKSHYLATPCTNAITRERLESV